jgi:hypothetical protein
MKPTEHELEVQEWSLSLMQEWHKERIEVERCRQEAANAERRYWHQRYVMLLQGKGAK